MVVVVVEVAPRGSLLKENWFARFVDAAVRYLSSMVLWRDCSPVPSEEDDVVVVVVVDEDVYDEGSDDFQVSDEITIFGSSLASSVVVFKRVGDELFGGTTMTTSENPTARLGAFES